MDFTDYIMCIFLVFIIVFIMFLVGLLGHKAYMDYIHSTPDYVAYTIKAAIDCNSTNDPLKWRVCMNNIINDYVTGKRK